ncbi:hypothetical protein B0E38_04758 [Streptomyces sp. 111WW2]|uniref:hypothetical protein n=1 Tax=Streptomyces sp. 111WW2 TaxID=1945515 RepID=UPI000D0C809B|nr:hypothetical protein [Streptomyces sp. 111WW2]PSK52432.1 hypothetical protein B0E38_04758 [Streptomyces sp. 111WW2]
MSAVDFKGVARLLAAAATAMERNPRLNPDQALRLVVWGDARAQYPGAGEPGADLYDEAHTAIEAKTGWQGHGIDHIPAKEAIPAARAEAARFHEMGGGH